MKKYKGHMLITTGPMGSGIVKCAKCGHNAITIYKERKGCTT